VSTAHSFIIFRGTKSSSQGIIARGRSILRPIYICFVQRWLWINWFSSEEKSWLVVGTRSNFSSSLGSTIRLFDMNRFNWSSVPTTSHGFSSDETNEFNHQFYLGWRGKELWTKRIIISAEGRKPRDTINWNTSFLETMKLCAGLAKSRRKRFILWTGRVYLRSSKWCFPRGIVF